MDGEARELPTEPTDADEVVLRAVGAWPPDLRGDVVDPESGERRRWWRMVEIARRDAGLEAPGMLRAPFPWFGGKSRAWELIWMALGDVANYVEPFAGSLAVLLARPHAAHIETVNDLNCYLVNFWRAVVADPDAVARYADWPVNEADLHARHTWLVAQEEFRARMTTDPDYFDVKVAGWWVWGLSCWIGGGWCDVAQFGRFEGARPHVSGDNPGMGVHRRRPMVRGWSHGNGVHQGVHQKRPIIAGDRAGNGIHQMPAVGGMGGKGLYGHRVDDLASWFRALQARLRPVRVCCGDWRRVLTNTPLRSHGWTGVLLDPPYSHDVRDAALYTHDNASISGDVRAWALEHGDDPKLRIVLCGYEGEHTMPASWRCVAWKAGGGYGSQRRDGTNTNARKERLWLSPHCLRGDGPLFEDDTAGARGAPPATAA